VRLGEEIGDAWTCGHVVEFDTAEHGSRCPRPTAGGEGACGPPFPRGGIRSLKMSAIVAKPAMDAADLGGHSSGNTARR